MIVVTWTARAFMAAIVIAWGVAGARVVRDKFTRAGRVLDEAALDIAAGRHPAGGRLPGPDHPQPSGVGTGEDTGIGGFTPEEMAYLRGETDELPR
jgi:hypothetical protein